MSADVCAHLARLRSRSSGEPRAEAVRLADGCLRRLATLESRSRRILGELLEVFRRRDRAAELGFVRFGDYTRERLGWSASEADTAIRVAKRLRRLPLVARALEAGEIPWTKARLLVRAAVPDTESEWLEAARGDTVRRLERRIASAELPVAAPVRAAAERELLQEEDGERIDGEPAVRFGLPCPGWAWIFFRRVVELARRACGEELPVWQAVEAIGAEGLSGAPAELFSDDMDLELRIREHSRAAASSPAASLALPARWLSSR
ncbi:MAG: DUF222 domain-containing protein, partial [Candidatus Binatia bacterium]